MCRAIVSQWRNQAVQANNASNVNGDENLLRVTKPVTDEWAN